MKQKLILGAAMAMAVAAQPPTLRGTNPILPPTGKSDYYYDIDGDGRMEWYSNGLKTMDDNGKEQPFGSGGFSFTPSNMTWLNAGWFGDREQIFLHGERSDLLFWDAATQTLVPAWNASASDYWTANRVDADNDGRPELLERDKYSSSEPSFNLLKAVPQGRALQDKLNWMTWDDYLEIVNEPEVTSFTSSSIPSLRDGFMITDPHADSNSFTEFLNIDFNGDGLTDLFDGKGGRVYFNVDQGRFVVQDMGGQILMRDFNGDGLTDYVLYDQANKKLSVYYTSATGEPTEKKILSGYNCGQKVWTADLDKDGRPDIVCTICESGSPYSDYVVVFQNKGDGSFTKKEYKLPYKEELSTLLDIDADGNYELLPSNYSYSSNPKGYHKFEGITFKPENVDPEKSYQGTKELLDPFNTGTTYYFPNNVNQRPTAPGQPSVAYDAASGMVSINWPAATDAETATIDLQYALRVGTAEGKDDVVPSDATASGLRRSFASPNMGYSRRTVLDASSWPSGTLYVSVQAVDPNNRGSEFSTPATFTKPQPANGFMLSHTAPFGVGAECVAALTSLPVEGAEYRWDFDGATVKEASADGGTYTLVWPSEGKKTVTLQAVLPSGQLSTVAAKTIEVLPSNLVSSEQKCDFNIDLDQDGVNETYSRGFCEEQPDHSYAKIERIYNNHQDIGKLYLPYVTDVNHDGMADVVSFILNSYNLLIATNIGDKDLDIVSEPTANSIWNPDFLWDFNNDGHFDVITGGYLRLNRGDNHNFSAVSSPHGDFFYDFNRDGLMDYGYEGGSSFAWYINQGDGTFVKDEASEMIFDNHFFTKIEAIADFDGNGRPDYLCFYDQYGYPKKRYIVWDDLDETSLPGDVFWSHSHWKIFDLDNNGCPDIFGGEQPFYYFYPNRTVQRKEFDLSDYGETLWTSNAAFRRSDGLYKFTASEASFRGDNQKPEPPSALRASQNGRQVVIEWNAAADRETPAALMRHNLSIRRADGTYLISPCNSGLDGVPVSTAQPLVPASKFTMPLKSIPAGTYEVKVQGVDAWGDAGNFSEVFTLTVEPSWFIDLPTTAGLGVETEAALPAGASAPSRAAADIDWDGGRATDLGNGKFTVAWTTPGMKTVKVGDHSQLVYVNPAPEGDFLAPASMPACATATVTGSDFYAGSWTIPSDVQFNVVSATQATLHCPIASTKKLSHTVKDRFGVERCYEHSVEFTPARVPSIGTITVDADGHTSLTITGERAVDANTFNIYRSFGNEGAYQLIDNIQRRDYTDPTSDGATQGYSYRVSCPLAEYGETDRSEARQTVHVTLNLAANGSVNASWNTLKDATAYRLLAGPSASSLVEKKTVEPTSASADLTLAEGELFVAVEAVTPTGVSRSNVADSSEAFAVVPATAIEIVGPAAGSTLNTTTRLMAQISPFDATISRVEWSIVSGKEHAEISSAGLLTITSTGTVTVRARATDGSGVYDERTYNLRSGIEEVIADTPANSPLSFTLEARTLTLKGLRTDVSAPIYIVNLSGAIVASHVDASSVAASSVAASLRDASSNAQAEGSEVSIDLSALPAGVYIAVAPDGRSLKFALR